MRNFTWRQQYPSLYAIARKKNILVATVFGRIPLSITFCRGLVGNNLTFVGNNLTLWHNLVGRVVHIRLNNREDV
jgi:hypothetical protein